MAPFVVLTHVEDPYASHWSCRARAPCAEETFDDHWTCRERPPPVSTPRKTFLARRAAASTPDVGQPMRHPGVLALPQDKTLVNLEGNIGAGKSTLPARAGGGLRRLRGAVRFVDEPVAQWEARGLLAALYAGKMSLAAFQLTALVTRAAALKEALADPVA